MVGIDAEAGPTEIAILADDTADPAFVAADLVTQAEHDPLAACLLVTDSAALADAVDVACAQVAATKHRERVEKPSPASRRTSWWTTSTRPGGGDAWAAEHLEVLTVDAGALPAESATRALFSSARTRRCRSATT